MSSGGNRTGGGRQGAVSPCVDLPVKLLLPWIACVLLGMAGLFQYEFTGEIPESVPEWPPDPNLELASDRPTLLLFVHPRCPCTAASIAELDRVLSDAPDAFRAYALFPVPTGTAEFGMDGPNYTAAGRLPGITRLRDRGGDLSRRFGAQVSGTVLAYRADGALLFRGGMTASRGHEGPSTGALALRSLSRGEAPAQSSTPVFGCTLWTTGDHNDKGDRL